MATTGTTATDDVLADLVLTYTTGSGLGLPDVDVLISVDGGAYMPCAELVAATSQSTDCAFTWLYGGNQAQVSVGNGIRIFENGQDLCATSTGCSVEWKLELFQQGQVTSAYPAIGTRQIRGTRSTWSTTLMHQARPRTTSCSR